MEDNNNVIAFYENNYKEDEREERETLEFFRSKDIISRYLAKPCMEIADVGGATGAYSFWLASMGHQVHLLDLLQNHIEIAKRKSKENGLALASYLCADARELPYNSECMDMVLLIGALYHLHSPEARVKCLLEAYRVIKPGGLILCTVINRWNTVIAPLKYKIFDSYGLEYLEKALTTGAFEKGNFYSHTPDEIIEEITSAGFNEINLIAVEGIANILGDNKIPADITEAAQLFWGIERTESLPELIGVSRNIIAVGSKHIYTS